MPNHRDPALTASNIETANPWGPERWADAESQDTRGAPGSRGANTEPARREHHSPDEWTGVRPLPPILPAMPSMKPGDQAG